MNEENPYTKMQKSQYYSGTSNHLNHNDNPDYWNILLSPLKDSEKWKNKNGLDFACGKGRNVTNLFKMCEWNKVDGIDISFSNIEYCRSEYKGQKSSWYLNNGIDVSELKSGEYDFIMSTIALQHIPVYDIRKSLIADLYRVLSSGGVFSFQMGFGSVVNGSASGYYENFYSAQGTNSVNDVRVIDKNEIISDLISIGFESVECQVRDSFSDDGHPQWIYTIAIKK